MTLITTSKLLPEPWPGLNRMADLGQTGQLYGQYKGALTLLLDNRVTRSRYCLRSHNGFATRTAALITQRKPFNWLITKQPPDVSSSGRVDLLPCQVTFELNDEPGDQLQREGESYAEFMDRLYAADPYANRKRDERGITSFRDGSERPKWYFVSPRSREEASNS